jgi:hypothetical protein
LAPDNVRFPDSGRSDPEHGKVAKHLITALQIAKIFYLRNSFFLTECSDSPS